MNRMKVFATTLAFGATMLIGASGAAFAYPGNHWGGQAMTQEQQAAFQKEYADHYNAIAPLRQELLAKRSELRAMSYSNEVDNGKVQALYKDIADAQAKLFMANAAFQKKLADKGIPYAGTCMGRGGHHGGFMNQGHGMRGGHGGGHW